jgi:hypothetical protein
VTTTAAEPSATDVYALGRDPRENARLQRQSDELRADSTALLDPAGLAATPFKTVPPPGSGLGTRVHVAPSQRSISALSNMPAPTAQASSAETAAAPLR